LTKEIISQNFHSGVGWYSDQKMRYTKPLKIRILPKGLIALLEGKVSNQNKVIKLL